MYKGINILDLLYKYMFLFINAFQIQYKYIINYKSYKDTYAYTNSVTL